MLKVSKKNNSLNPTMGARFLGPHKVLGPLSVWSWFLGPGSSEGLGSSQLRSGSWVLLRSGFWALSAKS